MWLRPYVLDVSKCSKGVPASRPVRGFKAGPGSICHGNTPLVTTSHFAWWHTSLLTHPCTHTHKHTYRFTLMYSHRTTYSRRAACISKKKSRGNKIGHIKGHFSSMRVQHMCARACVIACVCVLAPFGLESASLAACLQFKQLGWQRGQTGCYKTSPCEVERKGLRAVCTTSMSCTRTLYVRVHGVTYSTLTQVAVEIVF